MKKIAVLGAGIMGAGIAQVAAQSGYSVVLRDLQISLVNDGLRTIEENLNSSIERGELEAGSKEKVMGNIRGTIDLFELKDVDLVIEAVVENMEVKKQIFSELDMICPEHTILATNTSSLSITEIASATRRPDRVLGMHFFNPLPHMRLVELVNGLETSDETMDIARDFVIKLGKEYVILKRESPGFIVNRILIPYLNEAVCVYGEGLADRDSIDMAVKLGANMSQGPLEMADLVGLDTLYSTLIVFGREFHDEKYRPHIILSTMIRAGYLGKKSGQGFYEY